MRRPAIRIVALALWLLAGLPAGAAAGGQRYALLVTGASDGPPYAGRYDAWRQSLVTTLRARFQLAPDHLVQLAERPGDGVEEATAANVRRALQQLRGRMTASDLLLVVLIGHGTFDGTEAKFNLVGPDLDSAQWAALLAPLPGRLVFVDTTGASFPFLPALSARGRVVLTATDSTAERYETVFPEFFIQALDDPAADANKDGRVSIWEAFAYASAAVRRWYAQHGQLPTERPALDDNGDRIGTEAGAPGLDGALARNTYLDSGVGGDSSDSTIDLLRKQQAAILASADALKARKASMPPDQYEAEFEKLMIALAKVSRQLRLKSGAVSRSTIPPAPAPAA